MNKFLICTLFISVFLAVVKGFSLFPYEKDESPHQCKAAVTFSKGNILGIWLVNNNIGQSDPCQIYRRRDYDLVIDFFPTFNETSITASVIIKTPIGKVFKSKYNISGNFEKGDKSELKDHLHVPFYAPNGMYRITFSASGSKGLEFSGKINAEVV